MENLRFFEIESIVNRMMSSNLVTTVEVENQAVSLDFESRSNQNVSCSIEINNGNVTVECNFGETDFALEAGLDELRSWVAEFAGE